jgi:hypothetical protein
MFLHTAPLSNHHIFRPANTGSPRWDLYDHLSRLPQTARIDFEDHSLAGGLIIRVEPDLGSAAEREAEAKIVSVPYAVRVFGNTEDAVEFIRCVNLIAGADARPFNLQIVASYFYCEARTRPVREVLKEMALLLLALEMTAVTATEEERQFGDISETILDVSEGNSQLSQSDRRALSQRRAAEVLGETEDETSVFELELRAVARFRVRTSGFAYDEFAAYLTGCESLLETADEVDALYDSFESVYEQYDEDHVVSLHMSDGERVKCVGALEDDVDADSLPEELRHLARELYRLYTGGFPLRDRGEESGVEGIILPSHQRDPRTRERVETKDVVYGLDTWLDAAVDAIYHERVLRTARHLISVPLPRRPPRIVRMEGVVPYLATVDETRRGVTARTRRLRHALRRVEVSLPASRLHEQTSTVEVCPHAAGREQTRAVLEVLLERLKSDCHLRGLHASAVYRELVAQLAPSTDTGHVAKLKKEAWEHKENRRLSLKLFTAFNTRADVRRTALESVPLRVRCAHRIVRGAGFTMTQTYAGGERRVIVAQPLLNRIESLTGRTLSGFAAALHELPRQEKERVCVAFRQRNPRLYGRVREGLSAELSRASEGKLRYFRWALYAGNKPDHPVHTLTREDRAAAWELLKSLSRGGRATPAPPLLLIAESPEDRAEVSAQPA